MEVLAMATYRVICGIPGKYFDDNSYHDLLNYIFSESKTNLIGGAGFISLMNAAAEMETVAIRFGKNSGKRVRHSILSFRQDENISAQQAYLITQDIIRFYAPEYQIAFAVHQDTDEVHIHMVMNQISFIDGHRYRGQKKDYYDFMRYMGYVTHRPIIPVKDRFCAA